jgi:hypothetical protein
MYTLVTLWPRAGIGELSTWAEALAAAQERVPAGNAFVVIDWRSRDRRPTDLRAFRVDVEQVLATESLDREPLRAYVLRRSQ